MESQRLVWEIQMYHIQYVELLKKSKEQTTANPPTPTAVGVLEQTCGHFGTHVAPTTPPHGLPMVPTTLPQGLPRAVFLRAWVP